jgi:hypothetical protein
MSAIDGLIIRRLEETAVSVLNFLRKEWPEKADLKDRKGGYYCVAELNGSTISVTRICVVRDEKRERYESLAQEKVQRLGQNPRHVLSLQSRDEAKDRWGGAVRGQEYLHGFSGLTERLDSLVSIGIALANKDLDDNEAEEMFRQFFPDILQSFINRYMQMAQAYFDYSQVR